MLEPVLAEEGRIMLQRKGVAELCTHILRLKAKLVSNFFSVQRRKVLTVPFCIIQERPLMVDITVCNHECFSSGQGKLCSSP